MFGYVVPQKDTMRKEDFAMYRAFYCGLCVSLKDYGSVSRLTTSYDTTFLAALLHDVTKQSVEFDKVRCVGNPFSNKVIVTRNPLLERICAANVILSYYKACDDVIDGGGNKKRMMRALLKKAYRKAVGILPKADEICKMRYAELREAENRGERSIDRVADSFACLLRDLTVELLGGECGEEMRSLCYNLGKFVYIIDALDDVEDDFKTGCYNPFLAAYGKFDGRREFYKANAEAIGFTFACTVNRIIESFNRIQFTQCYSLLRNVVYEGLRGKVQEVLSSDKKIPLPRI